MLLTHSARNTTYSKMQCYKTTYILLWDNLLINETLLRGLCLTPLSWFPQKKINVSFELSINLSCHKVLLPRDLCIKHFI